MKIIIGTTILFLIFFSNEVKSSNKTSMLDSIEIKIDSMVARMGLSSETPGGVVGIIKDGEILFKKAYGLSNFEKKVINNSSTLFNVGSVAKQFTAAAILLLSKENKLSLKDDIKEYLLDFPDYGHTITIENLIHHTSGIKSYDVLKLMAGNLNQKDSQEEVYKLIKKQKSLNFKPGDEHLYSNSGYVLLAIIIEKVSGMRFCDFVEEKIFKSIGMNHSYIYDNTNKIIKSAASGHSWGGENIFKTTGVSEHITVGSSNVFTSIEDFLQWDKNFYENKLGNWDFSKGMLAQVTLNNGDTCNYCFGLERSEYKGFKIFSHQGGTSDFTAQYIRIPSEKFSVVCLFNIPANVTGLAYQIIDLFYKDILQIAKIYQKPEKIAVDSTILQGYEGKYFDENYWLESTVIKEGDHLAFDTPYQGKLEIYPCSDSLFFVTFADLKFAFIRNSKGKVEKASIIQGNQKFNLNYLGTKTQQKTEDQLHQYAGVYYCEEIDATYPMLFKDSKLFVKFPEYTAQFCNVNVESEMVSEHDDYFASSIRSGFKFTRNNQNEVSGFIIKDVGRVRNLIFHKVR